MRPEKKIVPGGEKPASKAKRATATSRVRKGRYSSTPPETAGDVATEANEDELEIQVGDVTLVVKEPVEAAGDNSWAKYDARPSVGYGAPVQDLEEKAATVVIVEADEEPLPTWGEWTSETVITEDRYYRSDSRPAL